MASLRDLGRQPLARALALVYGALTLLLVATFAASRALDRPREYFAQDPTETLDAPAYTGFLTLVVALLWAAAATCCALGWVGADRSAGSPFLWSGLFVLLVLSDDVFRLHESYYPSLGFPQPAVAAGYGVVGAAYLWVFRGFIRANAAWLFVLGLVLLGLSAGTDELLQEDAPFLTEEGAKLLGVAAWVLFYADAALARLGDARNEPVTTAP
jgi:hypothetical protein